MKILLGVLMTILIIVLYLVVDYKMGRKKMLSEIRSKEFSIRNSQIEIFTRGPLLFDDYFQTLKNAKKHIHVLFYISGNDQISRDFYSILIKKAQEGIEVRLLLDWAGSFKLKKKQIKLLKEAGVKFSYSNVPSLPFLFYSLQTRNHRKITVIDGVTGYLGGYNIGNEYIDLDPKLSPWRDYHLKMAGEGVSDLQKQFLLDWEEATKTNLLQNEIYFPKHEKGSICHKIISTEGFLLEETFSELIKNAKWSIFIGSPYFIPSQTIFQELKNALGRNVSVTIVVPYLSDHILVREASYPYLRELIRRGAKIYQYKKGFYHAKVLLIDNGICDLGTANFDNRSFFLNHEINCYIYDQKMIQQVIDILEQDLEDSEKLTLHDLNALGFLSSLKETTAKLFVHFL